MGKRNYAPVAIALAYAMTIASAVYMLMPEPEITKGVEVQKDMGSRDVYAYVLSSKPDPEPTPEPQMEYVGEYMCTAYCCEKYKHICGTGDGITASGVEVTPGVTVAADTSVFPFGTVLYIEGVGERVVQDIGGAIKGNRLDVAIDTHENALRWSGYGEHAVYVVEWGDEK